jgi:hypothetical protein
MKQIVYLIFLCVFSNAIAQSVRISGHVGVSENDPLFGVVVSVDSLKIHAITNALGYFEFSVGKEFRSIELIFRLEGYKTKIVPIDLDHSKAKIDLGFWFLFPELDVVEPLEVFDLQSNDFNDLEDNRSQFLGALQARRTVFLEAAAFQFSSSFFSARGLESQQQEIRVNGIRMNAFDNGRAVWSSWGGLNDITNKAQQTGFGIAPTGSGFGGVLGHTSFDLRPSNFRKGNKISQAFSNASYRFRTMVSHHSGLNSKQWAYSFLVSSRLGNKGYVTGTPYRSFSGALIIEKKWNENWSSWFTALYTPTTRAKNAPLTEEVFKIRGKKYNPYWGIDKGKVRNIRVGKTQTPILTFNHEWSPSDRVRLRLNTAYQFGLSSNSCLAYTGGSIQGGAVIGGARNPDPVYYQNLPSYFLRDSNDPDLASAYLADQNLRSEGQIDWESIQSSNEQSNRNDARYFLYEDQKEEDRISTSLSFLWKPSASAQLQTELIFIQSEADYHARPTDLLGAKQLLDVDLYAPDLDSAQNNIRTPNAVVGVGDQFQYAYRMDVQQQEVSSYWLKETGGYSFYVGGRFNNTRYQRTGFFQNGGFPDDSFGEGEPINFKSWSGKIGGSIALNGRHRIFFNGLFSSQPPSLRNTFSNPREQHRIIPNIEIEQTLFVTTKYHWQASWFDLQVVAYWGEEQNGTQLGFYFADGVGGDEAFFVQEVLQEVQKNHQGLELGWKATLADVIQIKAAVAIGVHQYGNNPNLSLFTEPTAASEVAGFVNGAQDFGVSQLRGYFLRSGPQQAYSFGIEYSDPAYWRIGIFGNYFAQNYLSPNPLRRTQNFLIDSDGVPFPEFDSTIAAQLLEQERFPSYFLLNATGGKSWKVKQHYFGFFISLQNLLNTTYKTGGFEQGRNANYRTVLEDNLRKFSLFAPKYWWGRGTTFFTSIYFRF